MGNFISRFFERRRMEREGQLGTRKRRTDSLWGEAADRSPVLTAMLVIFLLGVCITVLTLPQLRKYPVLVANQLAPETIFAQVDFAYEDKAATQQKRIEATEHQPSYFLISDVRSEHVRKQIDELYQALRQRSDAESANRVYPGGDKVIAQETAALSPTAFLIISRLDRNQDPMLREQFRDEVERMLNDGIINPGLLLHPTPDSPVRIVDRAGRERWVRTLKTITTCQQAAQQLAAVILSYSPELKASQLDIGALERLMLTLVGKNGNLELDSKRTEAQKEEAVKKVQSVMVDVKKNDILVKRNTPVTARMLDALSAQQEVLTLHNQEEDKRQSIVRNSFWSLILVLFAGFYLVHIHPEITRSSRRIAMIVTISALALGINYLAREAFYILSGALAIPPSLIADALPLALPAVLLTVMAGFRVALYIGFFTSMVSALMLGGSFNVALEGFILSALCGLMVRPSGNYRSFFLRTFLCVAITVWLLDFNVIWHIFNAPKMLMFSLCLALGNALFTAVSAMLLTFLFELMFNVSTNMSLMVLCDGNHPLLKELHLKSPGTSQHSQNVALLSEAAAEEIEANAVLARAGALFHDIGKIKNPEYFIENNQTGSNPHDKLNPRMSSLIISNHVKDGLDMAVQYKLCRSVRQFIQQHHGDDLIQYFYHKAMASGEQILENDYRYPGPLPHEKEVVIVSLADACEAACRTLEKPTPSKIEALVNEIFRKRWRDGQLNDANLTVEELSRINESFVFTLTTRYHSRIAYPKDENCDEDNVLFPERSASGTES